MGDLALGTLIMGLLGGLAIFLFGMEQMTDSLKSVAGAGMSAVLAKLTSNRLTAALTGAFVTAVIQSSSVTTVLVVGFISAGLMSVPQSIGVIMGANVGTTVTAQIIAFKITEYALGIVAIGFAAMFFTKRPTWRLYGAMVMGLGMIFLGMGVMSEATSPLRTYDPFIDLMGRMDNPLLGILVAAAFTALVQSSSATTGIVIVLASQGFITLEAGIALAFGANIGTCVTASLAALGQRREAKQAAVVHLVFNALGVIVWLPFIGMLASIVTSISPAHGDLEGTARLAAETPRQVANAHTIFNVANTCIFICFTAPLGRFVMRLFPEREEVVADEAQPRFIQEAYLQAPALALDRIRLEITRLGEQVTTIGEEAGPAVVSGDEHDVDAVVTRTLESQRLYDAINEYIRRLSSKTLTTAETRRLVALATIAGNVENAAETTAVNLVAIGRQRIARDVHFGGETMRRLSELGERVRAAFAMAVESLEDPERAHRVIDMKAEIQDLVDEIIEHLAGRLVADDPDRSLLYRLETQAVEIMERRYYFARKIAKEVVREAEASMTDPVATAEPLA